MLIVHGDEAEPQVLAALHMLSGCSSSHRYLLFFCATANAQLSRTIQDNKRSAREVLNFFSNSIVISISPQATSQPLGVLVATYLTTQLLFRDNLRQPTAYLSRPSRCSVHRGSVSRPQFDDPSNGSYCSASFTSTR